MSRVLQKQFTSGVHKANAFVLRSAVTREIATQLEIVIDLLRLSLSTQQVVGLTGVPEATVKTIHRGVRDEIGYVRPGRVPEKPEIFMESPVTYLRASVFGEAFTRITASLTQEGLANQSASIFLSAFLHTEEVCGGDGRAQFTARRALLVAEELLAGTMTMTKCRCCSTRHIKSRTIVHPCSKMAPTTGRCPMCSLARGNRVMMVALAEESLSVSASNQPSGYTKTPAYEIELTV